MLYNDTMGTYQWSQGQGSEKSQQFLTDGALAEI